MSTHSTECPHVSGLIYCPLCDGLDMPRPTVRTVPLVQGSGARALHYVSPEHRQDRLPGIRHLSNAVLRERVMDAAIIDDCIPLAAADAYVSYRNASYPAGSGHRAAQDCMSN